MARSGKPSLRCPEIMFESANTGWIDRGETMVSLTINVAAFLFLCWGGLTAFRSRTWSQGYARVSRERAPSDLRVND